MLVLARKPGESIDLLVGGCVIRIVMAELRGSSGLIGIEAPRSVRIVRSELQIVDAPKVVPKSFQPVPEDQENVPACV